MIFTRYIQNTQESKYLYLRQHDSGRPMGVKNLLIWQIYHIVYYFCFDIQVNML